MLWCCAIGGFAASTSYPLALALLFCRRLSRTVVQRDGADAGADATRRTQIRGRVIGLYNMSSLGLRAFAGVTVGLLGSLIGIHWSLALSAMALLSVTIALAALALRSR